jgi:hypothetical protein
MSKENYTRRVLKPLAKAAGIPRLNFQILRRSSSTHLQNLGSPKGLSEVSTRRVVKPRLRGVRVRSGTHLQLDRELLA